MLEREGSKNTGFKARPIVICQDPYCSDGGRRHEGPGR